MGLGMLSHFSVGLCTTLLTVARQAPLFMGFSRQEYWSGLPCPPSVYLPNPGIEPMSPALQVDSLPAEALGKPHISLDPSEPGGPVTDAVFHF